MVISEGVRHPDGRYLAEGRGDTAVDSFGHRQLGGAAMVLKYIIEGELGAKTRYCRPSIINRNGSHFASATDAAEAYRLGSSAVRLAITGLSGVMMTLKRTDGPDYGCEVEALDLEEVANKVRYFPEDWISGDGLDIDLERFGEYALPLIYGEVKVPLRNGLPSYVRLGKHFI